MRPAMKMRRYENTGLHRFMSHFSLGFISIFTERVEGNKIVCASTLQVALPWPNSGVAATLIYCKNCASKC